MPSMTRFVGDAIGVRSGRPKSNLTGAEIKKNMEKYLETGVHPEVGRLARSAAVTCNLNTVMPLIIY